MIINRELRKILVTYSREFRAVLIVGPRQSGKTTLAKSVFHPAKPYVSLENPDERLLAHSDPRAFLARFPKGAILDEVQRAPELLNYLQEILDTTDRNGLFILTGSNNILLLESVSQSLAGRIGVLDLLPLSYRELRKSFRDLNTFELMLKGGYPEIHQKRRQHSLWYQSYTRTYVERDVRLIKNIDNSLLFTKFLKLCAGRIGQQLNVSALSNDSGIDIKTVNSWLSILEQTYIIRLLPPYYRNFNKRLVKSPKLYFIDTGLACSLMSLKSPEELEISPFRGALFENFIVSEVFKNELNSSGGTQLYYWRDNKGVEIDLIIDSEQGFVPVEIKSAQTFSEDFLRGINRFKQYSGIERGKVVYDGSLEFTSSAGDAVQNWRTFLK